MNISPDEKQLAEALIAYKNKKIDCILCGNESGFRGVFIPTTEDASKKLNAPAGKMRCAIYGLCEKCKADPFAYLKAEDVLFRSQSHTRN